MQGDSMPDEWCSISEAARRLACSRAAVQQRVARGTLQSRTDNRGNPFVFVPAAMAAEAQTRRAARAAAVLNSASPDIIADAVAPEAADVTLQAHSTDLTAKLVQSYQEQVRGLQAVIEAAEQRHKAEVDRLHTTYRTQVDQLTGIMQERIDAAEVRAERSESLAIQALTQAADAAESITKSLIEAAAKPLWRRLFG